VPYWRFPTSGPSLWDITVRAVDPAKDTCQRFIPALIAIKAARPEFEGPAGAMRERREPLASADTGWQAPTMCR